jgi:rhamnosyltransferase
MLRRNPPEVSAMPENGVCAIVITFRPDAKVFTNLAKVNSQVQCVLAVDNGSSPKSLAELRAASRELNFTFIENGRNLGIATALNIGARWAISHSFRWIVLLDQDSTVTVGFVSEMLRDFESERALRNIMLLVPRHQDPQTGSEITFPLADDGGPLVTITSGSFFPANVFEQCGYFKDELFIYTVDDEYSLRLRSKGYSIGQSKTAILLHSAGFPSHHRFLGRIFYTSNHSAGARYYLNRNRIWMLRTYGAQYPEWTRDVLRACVVEFVKIVIAERSRWPKIKMIILGIRDGVLGRMGETVAL